MLITLFRIDNNRVMTNVLPKKAIPYTSLSKICGTFVHFLIKMLYTLKTRLFENYPHLEDYEDEQLILLGSNHLL